MAEQCIGFLQLGVSVRSVPEMFVLQAGLGEDQSHAICIPIPVVLMSSPKVLGNRCHARRLLRVSATRAKNQ
jgi:hypothetical protein